MSLTIGQIIQLGKVPHRAAPRRAAWGAMCEAVHGAARARGHVKALHPGSPTPAWGPRASTPGEARARGTSIKPARGHGWRTSNQMPDRVTYMV
jgi:hypothetical protein